MNIRKAKLSDADNLLIMLLALDTETKYMLLDAGERDNDVKRIEGMIEQSINGSNLLLIAEEENDIVGFLSVQKGLFKKIKHTGYIVVGIRKVYQGRGIGTKLFNELDYWAKENSISRLELTVMCPNLIAKHLYEKNGFVIEGIKRNSIFANGIYVDEYYMAKLYQ